MVAADLDRVSAIRPVVVMHQSGHIVNVNSEVLRRAGISRDTNVQGLVTDANGDPTGGFDPEKRGQLNKCQRRRKPRPI